MTWPQAYRIADEQITYWQRHGVSADEAEMALRQAYPGEWRDLRRKLAVWAMEHADKWGE